MHSKANPKYFSTICNYRYAIATRTCSINKDNLQLALQKQSVPQASQFFATELFVNQIWCSPREGNAPATKSEWNLSDTPRPSVTQIKVIINMTASFILKRYAICCDWLCRTGAARYSNHKPQEMVVYQPVRGKHTNIENSH